MSRSILSTVAVVSLLSLAPAAQAAPTQVNFAGTVTDTTGGVSDYFTIGNTVSGNFVYEPNTTNSFPNSEFNAFQAVLSTKINVPNLSTSLTGDSGVNLTNYVAPPTGLGFNDQFTFTARVDSFATAPKIGRYVISDIDVSFIDQTNAAITDANIIPTSVNLASYTFASFTITLTNPENGDDNGILTGTINLATTGEVVPEPAAATLLVPAIALLRRRR